MLYIYKHKCHCPAKPDTEEYTVYDSIYIMFFFFFLKGKTNAWL